MKTAAPPRPASKGANAPLAVCLAIAVAVATLPAGPAAALSRTTVERQTEQERTPWLPDGSATETLQDTTASAADPTSGMPTASATIPLPWLRLALPTLVCDGVLRAENSRLGLGRTGAASRLGRGPPNQRNALGKSARISTNCGGSYDSARYYDPRTAVWQSPDPNLAKYMRGGGNTPGVYAPRNLGLYSYSWNNPVVLRDPDGREPVKATAGMPSDVKTALNSSPSHVGEQRGTAAQLAIIRLGQTRNMAPENAGKIFGERSQNVRYVYTEQGGWIDMEHFSFYAGVAHEKKMMGEREPFAGAMRLGRLQELGDKSNSSFSYEDLPSDAAGAYFGAYVFDPKSSATLGQQVEQFLNQLGAVEPQDAPNWDWMPQTEESAAAQGRPTVRNYSPTPLFTKQKGQR